MKNKELAINALGKDCEVVGQYVEDGKTCALGCLALLAGIDRDYLEQEEYNGEEITHNAMAPVAKAIEEMFGLNVFQQAAIQRTNDRTHGLKARRKAVLGVIESFEEVSHEVEK